MAARCLALLAMLALLAPAAAAAAQPGPERALVSLDGLAFTSLQDALARAGGRVLERFDASRVALVEAPRPVLDALRAAPGVAGVYEEEPVALLLASSRPAVRVGPALWDLGLQGEGAAVAVVDSGIDGDHPGLAGRVVRSVRVGEAGVRAGEGDRDGHGTHIAGIVAGTGAGSPGNRHAGMAPRAPLVAVDISGAFTTTNAVRAFEWLHDHARELGLRVVSNSWGRERDGAAYDPEDPVIRASDALVRAGIVVVFSAGNRGPGPGTLTVEAQNPHVLTVGASTDEGRVEPYSSRGPPRLADGSAAAWAKPDVTAPGTLITSARAGAAQGGEAYAVLNGTSMAAPHVAGIAALMLAADPSLSPAQVKELLQRTARERGAPGIDADNGAGFVDGQRAVLAARDRAAQPAAPERAAFRGDGEVSPAAALLPVETHAAAARREVREPVAVPPGAVGLEFTLRWSDPRSGFRVTLERDGRVLGPFLGAAQRGAWMELRASVAEPLEAGAWDLVARPSGPSVAARYEVEGAVLVRHALAPAPLPPLAPAGSFPVLLSERAADPGMPWLAGLAAAVPAVVLAYRWRGGIRIADYGPPEPPWPAPRAAAPGPRPPRRP